MFCFDVSGFFGQCQGLTIVAFHGNFFSEKEGVMRFVAELLCGISALMWAITGAYHTFVTGDCPKKALFWTLAATAIGCAYILKPRGGGR
jgi:hypothetical protein